MGEGRDRHVTDVENIGGLQRPHGRTLTQRMPPRAGTAFSISTMKINLAFMNDLDVVAVRIEHPCRIIARIVLGPSLRCFLALASGVHSRFVECIYVSMV